MEHILRSWRLTVERIPFGDPALETRYNQVAHQWQHIMQRLGYQQVYTQLFAALAADGILATLPRPGKILDAGIGSGDLSLALAAQLIPPRAIHGIDLAAGMLRIARQRLQRAGIDACLVQADVRRLQYPANSFDLVMSAHTLEHLVDPRQGLHELVRVLQPGAPLVILMTRAGMLGTLIGLRWRVHATGEATLVSWLQALGLTRLRAYQIQGPAWCRWMSVACVGIKPYRIDEERHAAHTKP